MLIMYLSMLDTEQERQTVTRLYHKYRHICLHKALSVHNNQAMAEDAVHNAFMQVIENKEKYLRLPCDRLHSLIVVITKQKMIDLLRKQKVFINIPIDDMENELVSDEILPDLCFINQEIYNALIECIHQLDEKSKTILEMKYLLDMSYEEIAAELGISRKAVAIRIYRAKIKARAVMGKEVNNCAGARI